MAVDHDGRTCLRETARDGCANVLSRSRNDRDASVEVCLMHGRHQRAPLSGLDILRYSMREHWIRRRSQNRKSEMRASLFPENEKSAYPFRAINSFCDLGGRKCLLSKVDVFAELSISALPRKRSDCCDHAKKRKGPEPGLANV